MVAAIHAWGFSRTDRIFVQHRGQLSGLPKRWQSKAYIVPAIAGESGGVKPHCERERYVAWVAVLREVKRADLLIQIAREMPNIQFVVCGGSSSFASSPGYGERIVKELRAAGQPFADTSLFAANDNTSPLSLNVT